MPVSGKAVVYDIGQLRLLELIAWAEREARPDDSVIDAIRRRVYTEAIDLCGGSIRKAAAMVRITEAALRRYASDHGIRVNDTRTREARSVLRALDLGRSQDGEEVA